MTNPTELQYRLYVTQVGEVLTNLAANPAIRNGVFANVAWQVIMQTPGTQMAELRAVMAQAANLGMKVTPAFRCMEINPPLGWMDLAHWQRNADYLYLLICEFPGLIGSAIAFDIEAYKGAERPPDVAAQTIAMAPFLKAIRETRITPIIYPARPNHIPTFAIGDAVGGNLEVWSEAEYNLSEQMRVDLKKATATTILFSRIHTQFKQRWSNVVVRYGAGDNLLRDWGFAGRASMVDYGLWAPFLFDSFRFDNATIGTPEWCSGATLSTTNDIKHVWFIPSGPPPQGGQAMAKTRVLPAAPGARTDLSSTMGTLCTDGMALCAFSVIPTPQNGSSDITVQHEFLLPPTGGGPIFGACQMNHGSWQVVYDATLDQIVLELRQSSTSKVTSVITDKPPKMVPIRVIVSAPKAGTQWQHSARVQLAGAWGTVQTGSITPPIAVNAGAGSLWVGAGVVLPSGGAAKQSFFEGLMSTRTELHHRRMDFPEMALALLGPYPRSEKDPRPHP